VAMTGVVIGEGTILRCTVLLCMFVCIYCGVVLFYCMRCFVNPYVCV